MQLLLLFCLGLFFFFFFPHPPCLRLLYCLCLLLCPCAYIASGRDAHLSSFVVSGVWVSRLLPRCTIYAVSDGHELSSFPQRTNQSCFVFSAPLASVVWSLFSLRETQLLEASFRSQSESLSHILWVLSALLGYVEVQGFMPSDSSLFHHLVPSVFQRTLSPVLFATQFLSSIAHDHGEFYLVCCLRISRFSCSIICCSLLRFCGLCSQIWRCLDLVPPSVPSRLWWSSFSRVLVCAFSAVLSSLLLVHVVIGCPSLLLSRFFVPLKASGSWRLLLDLWFLNRLVEVSAFHLEALQSVLRAIRPGDWVVSLDLQDAYLQVPVHPESF